MTGDDDQNTPLDESQLAEIAAQLEKEESASAESILASAEGFEAWMAAHPAFRQLTMVDNFSEIAPSILNFLKAMLGFTIDPPQSGGSGSGAKAD